MKRSMGAWQTAGFLLTSILGTGLHFLFDLTGGSPAAALFSAVNESVWEHMKLLYFPMLLWSFLQYRYFAPKIPGFWSAKLAGSMAALGLIPALYYTYIGALGISADWFNIAIFFLAAGGAYFLEYRLLRRGFGASRPQFLPAALLLLMGVAFWIFTFFPPRIPLFQDPITGSYGFFSLSS